jgi:hypothetical protein
MFYLDETMYALFTNTACVLHVVHMKLHHELLHCKESFKHNDFFMLLMWLSWKHQNETHH